MHRILLILTSALLAGCGVTDPPLSSDAVRFAPPAIYARWWGMVEACSGETGRLADVQWYYEPNTTAVDGGGKYVTAYWSAGSNRIVVAGEKYLDGATVRHEMLHALTRRRGHSREIFLRRCGGIVPCFAECIADAGPPRAPPAGGAIVSSEFLELDFELETFQDPAASARESGFITMLLTVRNPAPDPVIVTRSGTYPAFFFEVRGGSDNWTSGVNPIDEEVFSFAGGEVKRQVFDFRMLDDRTGDGVWGSPVVFNGGYGRNYRTTTVSVPPG